VALQSFSVGPGACLPESLCQLAQGVSISSDECATAMNAALACEYNFIPDLVHGHADFNTGSWGGTALYKQASSGVCFQVTLNQVSLPPPGGN
jgi:hypothetical protein